MHSVIGIVGLVFLVLGIFQMSWVMILIGVLLMIYAGGGL